MKIALLVANQWGRRLINFDGLIEAFSSTGSPNSSPQPEKYQPLSRRMGDGNFRRAKRRGCLLGFSGSLRSNFFLGGRQLLEDNDFRITAFRLNPWKARSQPISHWRVARISDAKISLISQDRR